MHTTETVLAKDLSPLLVELHYPLVGAVDDGCHSWYLLSKVSGIYPMSLVSALRLFDSYMFTRYNGMRHAPAQSLGLTSMLFE